MSETTQNRPPKQELYVYSWSAKGKLPDDNKFNCSGKVYIPVTEEDPDEAAMHKARKIVLQHFPGARLTHNRKVYDDDTITHYPAFRRLKKTIHARLEE